jgi:hypothetical protein
MATVLLLPGGERRDVGLLSRRGNRDAQDTRRYATEEESGTVGIKEGFLFGVGLVGAVIFLLFVLPLLLIYVTGLLGGSK